MNSVDRLQSQQNDYLDRIGQAASTAELLPLAQALPGLWLSRAADQDAPALGHFVATVADALTARLLQFAEAELGPPPVPYAWIAYGSQGRQELTLNSDQDNALVLDDRYDPRRHGDYFQQLSQRVCDALAACGFVHCPGDMMASNPAWRLSTSRWCSQFTDWIVACNAQKARLASNFFDLRCIHGDAALCSPLIETIIHHCPRHESLLGHWVANASSTPSPLGMFRRFIVIPQGPQAGLLDLKRNGIIPIVELARIHALSTGQWQCGTLARLTAAAGRNLLSPSGAEDLLMAYRFLLGLRLAHQRLALMSGQPASNFIDPESLSARVAEKLRSAFQTIAVQQRALQLAFPYQPVG